MQLSFQTISFSKTIISLRRAYSVSQRYSQKGNALLQERSTTYRFLVRCRLIKDEDEQPERCSFYVTAHGCVHDRITVS